MSDLLASVVLTRTVSPRHAATPSLNPGVFPKAYAGLRNQS